MERIPEKEERGHRKEKISVRELKGLLAQPELQQAFVQPLPEMQKEMNLG